MSTIPNAFEITRRRFLGFVGPAVAVAGILVVPRRLLLAGGDDEGKKDPFTETPADDEGPFYREGAPARDDLRVADSPKPMLTMSGLVRAEDGKPLPDVTLDLWHCDAVGAYDNESKAYRHRGKVKTDKDGRFRFLTNYPGQYKYGDGRMRPRHIHCKLSGDGLYALTTQMYFEVRSGVDTPSELVPDVTWTGEGKTRAAAGAWNVFLARRPKD